MLTSNGRLLILYLACALLALMLANSELAFGDNLQRESNERKAYVWEFSTRDQSPQSQAPIFAIRLTEDFELALAELAEESFTILERRNLHALRAQADNEDAIADILDIPKPVEATLKGLGADVVVFGMVTDDVGSGELLVTVTVQEFSGRILAKARVPISRGKIVDTGSRQHAMEKLAKRVLRQYKRRMTRTMMGSKSQQGAATPADGNSLNAWLPWAVMGAGVAVSTTGLVLHYQARAGYQRFDERVTTCSSKGSVCQPTRGMWASRTRADIKQRVAWASYGVGCVLVAIGAIAMRYRFNKKKKKRGLSKQAIFPMLSRRAVGVVTVFRF